MWVAPLQGSQAPREVGATASLGLAGLCSDNTAVARPLQLSGAWFPCWPHYGVGPGVDTDELTPPTNATRPLPQASVTQEPLCEEPA